MPLILTECSRQKLEAWALRTPSPLTATTPSAAELLTTLSIFGDGALAHVIASLVSRLPPPVADYLSERVNVVVLGATVYGYSLLSAPPPRPWTMQLISFDDVSRFERLVAHETAHVWQLDEPTEPQRSAFWQQTVMETSLESVPAAAFATVSALRSQYARYKRDAIALARAWGYVEV